MSARQYISAVGEGSTRGKGRIKEGKGRLIGLWWLRRGGGGVILKMN